MAEDGEQEPRPPGALRDALGLQAGYAVRRAPPAAGAPDDSSNDCSLRQDDTQPRRPEVRPRSAAHPSNDGNLRQQSEGQPGGPSPDTSNDGNLRQKMASTNGGASTASPGIRLPSVRP